MSMDEVTKLLTALSSFSWPVLLATVVFLYKKHITSSIITILRKLDASTEIEIGTIKIKGAVVTIEGEVIKTDSAGFEILNANKSDVDDRHLEYNASRNLMIVHTIRPSDPEIYSKNPKLRIFDVSIFIHPHRNRGRLNEVKRVTYFLGDKWGDGGFGSKFVTENGNDYFAMTAQMFGSCLCVATIDFHDGASARVTRYLDVEMAPIYGVALRDARQGP